LVEQRFHCDAPLEASIDKLRGFIADHHATIVALDGNQVQLSVACPGNVSSQPGVQAETPNYILDLKYRERRVPREPSIDGEIKDDEAPSISHTTVDVSIRAEGTSNSGRRQLETAARKLLVSLRAYLMATDAADPLPPSIWLQAKAKLAALRARP
jgi:hypothetical protein